MREHNGPKELDAILESLRKGDYERARRALEELDREYPDNFTILYNLGMCYSDMGLLDQAISTLRRAVELAPTSANALVALAVAHARQGSVGEAEKLLRRALDLEPDNPYALRNLGAIRAEQGDYAGAYELLKKAARLLPDDPQTLYGLAATLIKLGRDDEADAYLKQLLQVKAPESLRELAKSLRREIAERTFKRQGLRMDAVLYCLDALKAFATMPRKKIERITYEIALLGRGGLDIHNPSRTYQINSLEGERTGLELLCWMYVGFKELDPTIDIGFDLSAEYAAARKLFEGGLG